MSRWLAEGRVLGASLRRFHSVVVAGSDANATADVALGIAEAQAEARRVVLGDLSANQARFGPLVPDDDPHGLVDAFDYGISLGRVARPVAGRENLHFAPTGSVAPDYQEILAHPRWAKLKTAFAESDHLLLIVLPLTAPGIADLVRHTDGIVLVDSMVPAQLEGSSVLANVVLKPAELPRPKPAPARLPVTTAEVPVLAKKAAAPRPAAKPVPVAGVAAAPRNAPPVVPTPARPPGSARPTAPASAPARGPRETGVFTAFARPAGYGAGLSILAALIIFWFMNQPFSGDREPRTATPGPLPQVLRPQPAVEAPADPNLPNPADSGAAAYAVRLLSANTQAGAILKLQEFGPSMPAVTYAPVEKSGQTWYEVLTGAYVTRGGADSLLTALRSAGRLDSAAHGVVVRVPYAVRIDSVRKSATVSDLLASLSMRLPVYALEQKNGWVWIVAGAFETRPLADSYSEKIRASGQPADVVLRQGRMF
ncbi:MAG TPA: hypothetical protein VFO55_05150 [Gemmatimonadaceae bacterium]|nr:hypothetical protein [Gemmatimonadaceae bacterium]